MPLIQGKSRKAMSENIKREMAAGKPQKQSIAIAYSVKRKNQKKMASGGEVNFRDEQRADADDASSERDEHMLHQSESEDSEGMGNPKLEESKKMSEGGEISFKDEERADADNAKDERDEHMLEGRLEEEHLPPRSDMDADEETPHSSNLESAYHSRYARGGEIDPEEQELETEEAMHEPKSVAEAVMAHRRAKKMADGGSIDDDQVDLYENNAREGHNMAEELDEEAMNTYGDQEYIESGSQPHDSNLKSDDEEMNSHDEDDRDMIARIRERMRNRRGY